MSSRPKMVDLRLKITGRVQKVVHEAVRTLHLGEKRMAAASQPELLPAQDQETPTVDFVFLSGPGQDRVQAWAAENDVCWPIQYLQVTIPNARVLAFSFENDETFSGCADRVCSELDNDRRDTQSTSNPIVFITRSLGGFVCAEIITQGGTSHQDTPARAIADSIQGVAFFGTPFKDSNTSELGEIVKTVMKIYAVSTSGLIDAAVELRDKFLEALKKRDDSKSPICVRSFAEGRQIKETKSKLVDIDAATIPGRRVPLVMSYNHHQIGTFEDADEKDYKDVLVRELRDLATIPKPANESSNSRTFNNSKIGNYAEGNVSGGQHDGNTGQINYGSIGTQNINGSGDRKGESGKETEKRKTR
ncbi:hypothetical protein F5Y16DRAFT_391116 [Xylariaceae sp. FL0255]|nr:hypothetical protein F5Y16DRAFT_391116 [Xylariaceae sp. FL0255]